DAEDEIEPAVLGRELLEVSPQELGLHPYSFDGDAGDVEDPLRDVDADEPPRPLAHARERHEIAAVPATGVEERLRREPRDELRAQALELAVERRVRQRRHGVLELRTPLVDV